MSGEGPLSDAVRHARHLASGGDQADEQLLARFVAARDEAAFAEIVRRHGPAVLRLCRQVLHNDHDAEDALQAAFLVLARKAAAVRRGGALAAWLYRVAHRIAAEARAAARRRAEREQPGAGSAEPVAPVVPDEVGLVAEAVAQLPDRYRAPVVLCYLEGRRNAEAARELGWPVGTVKASLSRARERLRRWLDARGVSLTPALLAPAAEGVPAALAGALPARAAAYAAGDAAGLSPSVLVLAERALRTMGTTKLKWGLAAALALGVCASVLAVWPGGPPRPSQVVRPPLPEKKAEPLFKGEHLALPIKARGRVVFSGDGKRLAWQQGGKVYVADLAEVVRGNEGGPKKKDVARIDADREVLDAVFLPDGQLSVASLGGPKGVKDKKVRPGDRGGEGVSLSPGSKWLAVTTKGDEVSLTAVGEPAAKARTVAGARFGAWSEDGEAAFVVRRDGLDVQRLTPADGKTATVVTGEELAKLCGVKLEDVRVEAASGRGAAERVFLTARQAPRGGGGFGVPFYPVPKGAERRGRSPGSAEPGPGPPTWSVLVTGGKPAVISANWRARPIDDIQVLPAKKLDRFLYAQMAQKGGAGDGRDPEVWLGTIDDKGKKTEKKLAKSPFPADWRDLRWTVLDVTDDAKRALVLVTCHVVKPVPVNGPFDVADLTMKYGRAGATIRDGKAMLKFQAWSLWSFDGDKAAMKQLTKLYVEKIADLPKAGVALEGKLATFRSFALADHVAYSAKAGVVALSLNTQRLGDAESLAPVVLLRVPPW